jgi:hypothetical protein
MQRNYGTRGRAGNDAGIRRVAPSFGRVRIQTRHAKAQCSITVDGHAERLTCCALNIDPSVQTYEPQPVTVDLVDGCLHHSKEAVAQARRKHTGRAGPWFYTPDHLVHWSGQTTKTALEVKDEAWQGDADYARKLGLASKILEYFGYEFRRVVIPRHPQAPVKRNLALLSQATGRGRLQMVVSPMADEQAGESSKTWTLSGACQAFGVSLQDAPWLMLNGHISMDLVGQHMKANSPVSLAWGNLEHLCLVRKMMQ